MTPPLDNSPTGPLLAQQFDRQAARTAVNLNFEDCANGAADRPAVNSFDVFDTLIARRCVAAEQVFHKLEIQHGLPGFAAARRAAEIAVSGPDLTLGAIYRELASRIAIDPANAMQAEIEAELAEVIPIADNLARVRDGDLLLSDMYLPAETIRALLAKAGLQRRVGLVVSADGKQSGRVWPLVQAGLRIERHLGDNAHSDVVMPRRAGIVAEHTAIGTPTKVEQWLLDAGCGGLGELVRAARLRIATQDPIARRLLLAQTQYNFPLLALASVLLHRQTAGRALRFASRDCNLWCDLHRALFPRADATYFYTSRRARVRPSPAYRAYARAQLADNAVLIDLVGSGWMSVLLMQSLGLTENGGLFFLHRIALIGLYEQQQKTPDICRVAAILGPERTELDHIRLEMANYAEHGAALDVGRLAGADLPFFDRDDRSQHERALIAAQGACFAAMVADAKDRGLADEIGLDDAQLADVIGRLYALLGQETAFETAFAASHHQEDLRTLAALSLIPNEQ